MPNPEYVHSDHVICIEELRSSFFAQNCLYTGKNFIFFLINFYFLLKGLSTLLTNILRPLNESKISKTERWAFEYTKGVSYNIYFQKFSSHWSGLEFKKIVNSFYKWKKDICKNFFLYFKTFIFLKVIIGIQRTKETKSTRQILLCPFNETIKSGDIANILATNIVFFFFFFYFHFFFNFLFFFL
jgi:hypothetical protein